MDFKIDDILNKTIEGFSRETLVDAVSKNLNAEPTISDEIVLKL